MCIRDRNDPVVSRRLPTIRLKFSADGLTATGRFIAAQTGDVGSIELALGWEPLNNRPYHFIEPLAGVYDARCPFGTVEIRSLHVVASRIYSEVTSNDGLPGAIQYIANGYCSGPAYGGSGNCAHATSGIYNFYEDIVVFNRGGVACRRANAKDLTCNLLGTVEAQKSNICTFVKRQSPQIQNKSIAMPVHPVNVPIVWSAAPAPRSTSSEIPCEKLTGTRGGVLTHLRDGRKQIFNLHLESISTVTASGAEECLVTGNATLAFPTKETLNFTFPAIQYKTYNQTMTLISEASSDASLTFDAAVFSGVSDGAGRDGYWFSRLFGAVGVIQFMDEGSALENLKSAADSIVYGANGRFDCGPKVLSLVLFASPSSTSRPVYWDPFNQQKYSGNIAGFNSHNPATFPLPSLTTPILESSFDYFTNSLVLDGSSLYTGYADADGLHIWGGPSRRYIKNVSLDEQQCVRQNDSSIQH